MKTLVIVAALAAGTALVSGALLLGGAGAGPRRDRANGTGGGVGSGATAAPDGSGAVAGSAAATRENEELRRRLRELEGRVEELGARLHLLAVEGTGDAGPPAAHDGEGVDAEGAEGTESDAAGDDADAPVDATAEVPPGTPAEREAWLRQVQESRRARRREEDLLARIEEADAAMTLQPVERSSLEDILRRHGASLDDLNRRTGEQFRSSGFGLTEVERQQLRDLAAERRRIDQDRDTAMQALVGQERWKRYQKARRDQAEKERTLRRLGQP